jgi:predicted TIM-barrel fold metal-dependent hydrolase
VPLYLHPGPVMLDVKKRYYDGFDKDVSLRLSLFGWGFHQEAGLQVLRLILSGACDRHPGLRIISGHWGETLPFYLHRLDDTMPRAVTGLSRTVSRTYRDQVFVTPSGMLNLPHFRFMLDTMGAERIMFSVDYPYLTLNGARRWLESLPISEAERKAIAHGNAETLLRLGR